MSMMKFIWESGHETVQINIDPDNYDGDKIRTYMDEFLSIYLNRTGKSKDVDREEYDSGQDQEEYQRIVERWKAKEEYGSQSFQEAIDKHRQKFKTGYVSTTAFDDQFRSEPTETMRLYPDNTLGLGEQGVSDDDFESFKQFKQAPMGPSVAQEMADTILPFLESLKKDPDKAMIRWNNREDVVNSKIKEIEKILSKDR